MYKVQTKVTGSDSKLKAYSGHLLEIIISTVELQWLVHLWDHENMFETGVVRVNEC